MNAVCPWQAGRGDVCCGSSLGGGITRKGVLTSEASSGFDGNSGPHILTKHTSAPSTTPPLLLLREVVAQGILLRRQIRLLLPLPGARVVVVVPALLALVLLGPLLPNTQHVHQLRELALADDAPAGLNMAFGEILAQALQQRAALVLSSHELQAGDDIDGRLPSAGGAGDAA